MCAVFLVVVVVISRSVLLRKQHFGAFGNEKERIKEKGRGKEERIEHLSFRGKLGAMKHELDLRTRERERENEGTQQREQSQQQQRAFLPVRSLALTCKNNSQLGRTWPGLILTTPRRFSFLRPFTSLLFSSLPLPYLSSSYFLPWFSNLCSFKSEKLSSSSSPVCVWVRSLESFPKLESSSQARARA